MSKMSQKDKKAAFLEVFLSSDLTVNGIFEKTDFKLFNKTMHYRYMKSDPDYAAAIAMGKDKNAMYLEAAEDALMRNVRKDNQKAIEFVLKHRGGDKWNRDAKKVVEHIHKPVAQIERKMDTTTFDMLADQALKKGIASNQGQLDALIADRLGTDFKATMEDEHYEFDD